jgi:very-short-patch-repair endonuclease
VLRFWGKDIIKNTEEITEKIISEIKKRKKTIDKD